MKYNLIALKQMYSMCEWFHQLACGETVWHTLGKMIGSLVFCVCMTLKNTLGDTITQLSSIKCIIFRSDQIYTTYLGNNHFLCIFVRLVDAFFQLALFWYSFTHLFDLCILKIILWINKEWIKLEYIHLLRVYIFIALGLINVQRF